MFIASLIKPATRVPVGMCSGPNSSSAIGLRKDTAGGTGSVLLLGKLFPDGSSAVSDTGVLGTGVIDECGSSGGLGISTQSSSQSLRKCPQMSCFQFQAPQLVVW